MPSRAQIVAGDRLLVGSMSVSEYANLSLVPLPSVPNQKFCTLVRLAPDVLAWAYVPTAAERQGDFSPFAGTLVDPLTQAPFPGGIIPASRIPDVFAWRLAAAGPGAGESCVEQAGLSAFSSSNYVTGYVTGRDTLAVNQFDFTLPYVMGSPHPAEQTLAVSSRGLPLAFEIAQPAYSTSPAPAFSSGPGGWLTITPPSPCCTTPANIALKMNAGGLGPGVHEATFRLTPINAIGTPQLVVARLVVSAPASYVVVRETVLEVTYTQQVDPTAPAPVPIRIDSLGAAQQFTVEVTIVTPPPVAGAPPATWLTVSPLSGSGPTELTVSFNLAELQKLGRGKYLAFVRIIAPGAPNSPVTVAIVMTVFPDPDFTYTPRSLTFNYTLGGTSPPQQRVGFVVVAQPTDATIAQTTFDVGPTYANPQGGNWLQVTPARIGPTATVSVSLNPVAAASLAPDRYDAYVNVSAGLKTGAEVPVTLFVNPALPGSAGARKVLAQVADGAGWKTTIVLVNTDLAAAAPFTIRFWPGQGTAADVPLVLEGARQLQNLALDGTIAAGGSLTFRTRGAAGPPLWQGWAEVMAPDSVGGTAIFRQQTDPAQDAEGAVPLKPATGKRFVLAFDNSAVDAARRFSTGFAIVNTSDQTSNVSVVIRGPDGQVIPSSVPAIELGPRGHRAFSLADQFGATSGIRGTAEFTSDAGDIVGLGLRFSPFRAFTSFETLAGTAVSAAQKLAHIADGQGWKTSIILVNLNTTAGVSTTLRFYPGQDTPASRELPLEGLTAPGGVLPVSLPLGGSVVINSRGSASDPLWQGWVEASSGAIGGFAVFRNRLSATQDVEGAVPLAPGGSSRFFVPFDNTVGLKTGLALVNSGTAPVTAVFRDSDGRSITLPNAATQLSMPVTGHTAFELTLPQFGLSGLNGVAEFSVPSGELLGLGLRFNDARLAFTSLPILRK